MFRIIKLALFNYEDEKYTYNFSAGINYFKGKNSSGKTEFYNFIDYMFGSSDDIRKKPWFKDSLKKASMEVQVGEITYKLTRFSDPSVNYLSYVDEEEREVIDQREYKEKLNSIFAKDISLLRSIRKFTEEELTFRAFTMFNFLGEQRQGAIHDFFDKCSNVKYSVKLVPILNFIFNNNLEKIYDLQRDLEVLQEKQKNLEEVSLRYSFICTQVNRNLQKLGTNIWYTGHNVKDIRKNLDDIKSMEETKKKDKERNIVDLEVMFSNISEQIKTYENVIADAKQFEKENKNRKLLLENLDNMLKESDEFTYLIEPLKELIKGLDKTISFGQYTINDKTIAELKKQRNALKIEIKRNDSRFKCFTMEEKAKAIALVEEYLSVDICDHSDELKEIKRKIREIKEEIKVLQNSDDIAKIRKLSGFITMLYKSASGISSVVDDDISQDGFNIRYLKRGNILQPVIQITEVKEDDVDKNTEVQYYIGSMARHTLIQLCGYLGFLKLLLPEEKYPVIPILVIDHISKPFDVKNVRAIGQIINKAIEEIGKENLQVFMFDDEDYQTLAIEPNHSEDLVGNGKTGFNPFYHPVMQKEEIEVKETEKSIE